ncbi:MAG: carboxy terminal-processing peptidase, partial [Bacteroidales bacterium]|nr:carboxy terminal-processing peptidase [Bacteroidales bacterium]
LTRLLSRMEQKKDEGSDELEDEDFLEEEEDVDATEKETLAFAEAEAWAREKVEKRYRDWFSRLKQVNRNDRLTVYINSFVSIYDPHSEYYPPKAKEDFDIRFSGQLEGIGATLQQEDGYVKVREIVAGSASWKQGELEVNDLILKVGQGAEEPVDIVDMRLDDAVRLIRGPKGTEVRLTVKKVDGSTRVIPIIRDVVVLEETFAKSAILEEDGHQGKIGYIMLPSFYMDFKDPSGRSAASDVLNEINKLKAEGISGLIIDLRGNGGGSLLDAVKMAGYFIEKGPVVQVKSRFGEPYVFDDKDPAVQYGGPLVVLVNSFSASASEIFAAAMQDYQRAIIVGSSSTFGKGTVQRFFELDKMVPVEHQDVRPLGSIKLTTQKFYRVNGGATQLKGVSPDLILPDRYSYIDIGEKERDYPMPWTVIEPANFTPWNAFSINYEYLRSNGTSRMADNSAFALIDEQARLLKDQRRIHRYPLGLEQYKLWKADLDEKNKKFKDLGKDTFDLKVSALPSDALLLAADSVKSEGAKKWHGQLKKDIYLKEAVDLLNIKGIVKTR